MKFALPRFEIVAMAAVSVGMVNLTTFDPLPVLVIAANEALKGPALGVAVGTVPASVGAARFNGSGAHATRRRVMPPAAQTRRAKVRQTSITRRPLPDRRPIARSASTGSGIECIARFRSFQRTLS